MWTDTLPVQLKAKVNALVKAQPSSEAILNELHDFLTLPPATKKRKIMEQQQQQQPQQAPPPQPPAPASADGPTQVEVLGQYNLKITTPVNRSEVICELSNLSFTSPTRRKYNLLFHLFIANGVPQPALSVVNIATNIPEFSIRELLKSIKLCVLIPILGNTTVPAKKDTGMLCFWLNEEASPDKSKNEPIICIINLDLVRKQLAKDGKIHPNAEQQVTHLESTSEGIKPVNGLILEFLERQFNLCGIQLINFMPSALPTRNALTMNSDNGVGLSRVANGINDFVSVSAYKGSKEGALVLLSMSALSAYMIFGFKKPILILDFATIRNVSYKDITKFTFTVMVTVQTAEGESVLDFSMIDQASYLAIEEFVLSRNIDDNSFDDKLKEKGADSKKGSEAPQAESEDVGLSAINASDDEEEDDSYNGGLEEDSDSGLAEEFDSNAESEGEDSDGSDDMGAE